MIQFTQEKVSELRMKKDRFPQTLARLKEDVQEIFENEVTVPDSGIANWTLFYYCPDCSVALSFDWKNPKQHLCFGCGKIYSGEPYDSAWWGIVNSKNCSAAFQMAIIWMITQEKAYAKKAADILLAYANNYENYQIHGNIPYNGPGRAGAQTLDEANFQRTLAMSYDILQDYLTKRQKDTITNKLFLPAARFLLEHRTDQIHNHEVIINSAIAVIGILLEREEWVRSALYDKYGFYYQLENGMTENGLWFEGAFSYHFYALSSFFAYEKFAKNTKFSGLQHPNYKKMMEMPLHYLDPDYKFPMINDANYGHESHMKILYEFAYAEFGGDELGFLLGTYYLDDRRDNIEAFLYGVDEIPLIKSELVNFHTPPGMSGHSILRGKNGKYLLFKHDAYGGEHDHYDRLSISYQAFGKRLAADLGTTGYGAKLHYEYYKNTGSHNTLVIGEENQAPVNAKLLKYEAIDGGVLIEAEADWTKVFQMPDSFTIVQWSEQNYRTVKMKRQIVWMDEYWLEVFFADGIPAEKTVDWVFHFSGEEISGEGQRVKVEGYFQKKPFRYLSEVFMSEPKKSQYFRLYQDGDIRTQVFGLANGQLIIDAYGPDNPSINKIPYLIERRVSDALLSAHVIESYRENAVVLGVEFLPRKDELTIIVQTLNDVRRFKFARS